MREAGCVDHSKARQSAERKASLTWASMLSVTGVGGTAAVASATCERWRSPSAAWTALALGDTSLDSWLALRGGARGADGNKGAQR